jgi:hypothetical protein
VSAASRRLWSAWDSPTGTFVYVTLSPTRTAVAHELHLLATQEVAAAGLLVVHQSIARYRRSPVPAVAACLAGRPIGKGAGSGSGQKRKGSFSF